MVWRETDARTGKTIVITPVKKQPAQAQSDSEAVAQSEKKVYSAQMRHQLQEEGALPVPVSKRASDEYYTAEYPKHQIVQNTAREYYGNLQSFTRYHQKTAAEISRLQRGGLDTQYVMMADSPAGSSMAYNKGQILTGKQLVGIISKEKKEYTMSYAKYSRSQGDLIGIARDAPEGTTFTKKVDEQGTSYTMNLPKSSDVVTRTYGSERLDLYYAKGAQDWGLPAAIAGFQTVTGIDRNAWENLHEQYASEIMDYTRKPGESPLEFTGRFWTSEQAITNVYIPALTFGVGYAAKPYMLGLKEVNRASRLGGMAARAGYYGSKYNRSIKVGMGALIGGSISYGVVSNPDAIPLVLGRSVADLGKFGAGFSAGCKAYSMKNAGVIQKMNWAGSEYEGMVTDLSRQSAVMESQYRPFEWGSPETHHTVMIGQTYAKIPYVPKNPPEVHSFTVGLKSEGNEEMFLLNKITVSSDTGEVVVKTPIRVKQGDVVQKTEFGTMSKKGEDITVDFFTGKVLKKGEFGETFTGFSFAEDVGEFKDFVVTKSYGKTFLGSDSAILQKGRYPDSMTSRSTSLSKTIYGERVPSKFGLGEEGISYDYSFSRTRMAFADNLNQSFIYHSSMKRSSFIKTRSGKSFTFDFMGGGGGDGTVTLTGTRSEFFSSGGGGMGAQTEQTFGSMSELGGFAKMGKAGRSRVSLEYDTTVSSYWDDARPGVQVVQVRQKRLSFVSVSMSKQSMLQQQRTDQRLSFSSIVSQRQRSETMLLSKEKTGLASLTSNLSIVKQDAVQDQRQVQLQRSSSLSLLKTGLVTRQQSRQRLSFDFFKGDNGGGGVFTPYRPRKGTTVVPPVFPVIPMDLGGGGYETGAAGGKRYWGFGSRRKPGLKMVLADPFSVMESQIKFGSATHQLPTSKVWSDAERAGWRLGTVEMRKHTLRSKKKKRKKNKKR